MEAIHQYALTLICTALVCGILLQLLPSGTMGGILRFVCSALMIYALIVPLYGMDLPDFERFFENYSVKGEYTAQTGADMAEEERLLLIKAGLEAYLLDRAAAINCQITADVCLNMEGYPDSILLTGVVSEDQRQQLCSIISNDLGIPEENQQWTV